MIQKGSLKIILFLSLFNCGLPAQDRNPLTIEQALEIGLANSKMLHSSQLKVKSSEARLNEVEAAALPALKFSASYKRLSPLDPVKFNGFTLSPSILNNYTTQLTLTQPLFTGFRLSSNTEAAELSSKSQYENYNKDKSELIFNIKQAYWTLFKVQQLRQVTDEALKQARSRLEDAENMLKAGMATQNDLLKLKVRLNDVLFQQAEAENAVRIAMTALNSLICLPLETENELTSQVNLTQSEYPDLKALISEAAEVRPEIKAAEYIIKASQAQVSAAKSGWYPQLSFTASYYYNNPNQRIFPSKETFKGTWDAGLNLNLNIWDWLTTRHQTEQAEASAAQMADTKRIIVDNISLEVTQNYLNMYQSRKKTEIAQFSVTQAEENMRMTAEQYKNGLALSTEVIDAQAALSSAKVNYVNSIVDYELSKAKLNKSIGK